jgi:hypothetical protein
MEGLITAVSGPLGALALCVAILWWLANRVVPVLQKYLESQSERLHDLVLALNRTIDAHEKDRQTFEKSIENINGRIDKVEATVEKIQSKLP